MIDGTYRYSKTIEITHQLYTLDPVLVDYGDLLVYIGSPNDNKIS